MQVAPPAVDAAGGTLEVEPDADVVAALSGEPGAARLSRRRRRLARRRASTDGSAPGRGAPRRPARSATRSRSRRARRSPSTAAAARSRSPPERPQRVGHARRLARERRRHGRAERRAARHGQLHQGAGATLALDLRSAADGDRCSVGGARARGHARGDHEYTPAKAARSSCSAPRRSRRDVREVLAPLPAGLAWDPAYGATGVTLGVTGAGASAPVSLTRPSLRPAAPVVGGRTRCLPGKWTGAHTLTYQWLSGGKPIAHANTQFRRVTPADRGRALACRVTAIATGGVVRRPRARPPACAPVSTSARSAPARRRRLGGARLSRERADLPGLPARARRGSLVASGHFAVRSPGGAARLAAVGSGERPPVPWSFARATAMPGAPRARSRAGATYPAEGASSRAPARRSAPTRDATAAGRGCADRRASASRRRRRRSDAGTGRAGSPSRRRPSAPAAPRRSPRAVDAPLGDTADVQPRVARVELVHELVADGEPAEARVAIEHLVALRALPLGVLGCHVDCPASSNCHSCARSQRPNDTSIAVASCANECVRAAANTRPGRGQKR